MNYKNDNLDELLEYKALVKTAVEKGLNIKKITSLQEKKQFRHPDEYPNPKKTLLEFTEISHQKSSRNNQ